MRQTVPSAAPAPLFPAQFHARERAQPAQNAADEQFDEKERRKREPAAHRRKEQHGHERAAQSRDDPFDERALPSHEDEREEKTARALDRPADGGDCARRRDVRPHEHGGDRHCDEAEKGIKERAEQDFDDGASE